LHNYKCTVEYKKGKDNVTADSLSRKGEQENSIMMVTAVQSNLVDQVRNLIQTDL